MVELISISKRSPWAVYLFLSKVFSTCLFTSCPWQQGSWGQHGAHLGWQDPCAPHVGPMNCTINGYCHRETLSRFRESTLAIAYSTPVLEFLHYLIRHKMHKDEIKSTLNNMVIWCYTTVGNCASIAFMYYAIITRIQNYIFASVLLRYFSFC